MALAGELAKYMGGELFKNTGKELAIKAAPSILANLAPKIATKAGAKATEKGILNGLVPPTARKLASGVELGSEAIPLFRGQTNRLDRLDYNKGLSPNSNGFFMTPNKGATDSWAGKGVVSVNADPNDIMTLDELRSLKKSAERYFRDPKYQMEIYNTNPTQAEIFDALEAGDGYQELSRLTGKPFIERDGGQGTELGEIVFFPDTTPELTSRYNADLASGKNQWLAPTEDVVASETAVPAGTKIKFDKDLSIKSINEPSRGRGWFANNSNNPHIAQAVKQSGADKYLGNPKINYSLAEEPEKTIYHGTPNKFEDFDESLPSVWFSDSDKNLRDTGLSIGGGQPMNIMERQLPRDLKIADEDLADRLTKQQLQDRGYAGIAYTERGPNGDETYYEIFKPNKTLKKLEAREGGNQISYAAFSPEQVKSVENLNPTSSSDIRLAKKNGPSLTEMANRIKAMNKAKDLDSGIKRIGNSEVAEIDANTLPAGYEKVKKYLGSSDAERIENATGASLEKDSIEEYTNKLKKFLEEEGYDSDKTGAELLRDVRAAINEKIANDLNMEGSTLYKDFFQTRGRLQKDNPLAGVGPSSFTISADKDKLYQTDAAKLDAEYSERLGIGRSHIPMADKALSSDAQGYYMGGGIGINPRYASGESGVSTIAHERMHGWQDINKGEWDSRVGDAIDELRNELKKHYHTKEEIKAYRKSGSDLDYYANQKEQEARMLQSYLDNEGFTKTWRKQAGGPTEWGDEIKPAFDKFYVKLRGLSKAGVALPAVALMFGLNTNSGDKSVDNIE